jgi:hypothetical protein
VAQVVCSIEVCALLPLTYVGALPTTDSPLSMVQQMDSQCVSCCNESPLSPSAAASIRQLSRSASCSGGPSRHGVPSISAELLSPVRGGGARLSLWQPWLWASRTCRRRLQAASWWASAWLRTCHCRLTAACGLPWVWACASSAWALSHTCRHTPDEHAERSHGYCQTVHKAARWMEAGRHLLK